MLCNMYQIRICCYQTMITENVKKINKKIPTLEPQVISYKWWGLFLAFKICFIKPLC